MGILKWLGPDEWTIAGLATGEDVSEGDLVLTTGFGLVFPAGIRVGVVKELVAQARQGSGFTRIEPFAKFDSIEELFVVVEPETQRQPVGDSLIAIEAEE
jgi:rod shape-determining protein MreC